MSDLTKLAQLAEQHSSSYASPHHFVLSVAGLRSIIAAVQAAQPEAVGEPVASVRVEGGMMRGATRRPGMASLPDGDHKLYAAAPTEAKPAQADALNTLCKMLHSGEEVEGDDGLAMLVPMDLWNEAQEAIELLVGEDTEAKPDCAGGIACTTCPDKRKCQRGCIRQGEALENPDRKDLRAECDAVDALLRGLGLEPERCRTEGGALNVGRTLSLLADGVKAKPVAWGMRWQGHGPIMDCITPEEHERHEGEYTVPLFATPLTEAKPAQDAVGARPLMTGELADVTAPWAHIWTDQSFGIANAAIDKFCEVNGIRAAISAKKGGAV